MKNRAYRDHAMLDRRVVVTHAEYGIVDGDQVLARIVRNGNKWIALQVTNGNFGTPVSPLNYVLLRDVKEWAMEKYRRQ